MNYVTSRKVPLLHCLRLYVTSDLQLLLRTIMPHFNYINYIAVCYGNWCLIWIEINYV